MRTLSGIQPSRNSVPCHLLAASVYTSRPVAGLCIPSWDVSLVAVFCFRRAKQTRPLVWSPGASLSYGDYLTEPHGKCSVQVSDGISLLCFPVGGSVSSDFYSDAFAISAAFGRIYHQSIALLVRGYFLSVLRPVIEVLPELLIGDLAHVDFVAPISYAKKLGEFGIETVVHIIDKLFDDFAQVIPLRADVGQVGREGGLAPRFLVTILVGRV